MTAIIRVIYMILYLYSTNPVTQDPINVQSFFSEYQVSRMEAAVGELSASFPEKPNTVGSVINTEAGINMDLVPFTPAGINPDPIPATPAGIILDPIPVTPAGIILDPSSVTPAGIILDPSSVTPAGIILDPVPVTPAGIILDPVPVTPAGINLEPIIADYQKELVVLGFYKEESKDKKLNLRNAVLRFQSSCNMTVNGKWDSKCLKALSNMISTQDNSSKDIITSPPTEDLWIVINKSKRILTLYEGSNILKKYPVAIGNPSKLTPEGKFSIVNKVIDPTWGGGGYSDPVKGGRPDNPLGHRWMGLSYKGGGDLGIHGNNSPYSIGKDVSHGCIRMINSDVEELFEIIPKSIKVWIGTNTVLKAWGIEQLE